MHIAFLVINNKLIKIVYDDMYDDKVRKVMGFCNNNRLYLKLPIIAEIKLSKLCLIIKCDNIIEKYYKIEETDIYHIMYSFIYKLMNKNNIIMMHSSVVSNVQNDGLLILGDFGSGKTTLMKEFIKSGYTANSTDQSLLSIANDSLTFCCGSTFYSNAEENINYEKSVSSVKIKKIIIIDALTSDGEFINRNINDSKTKFRKIWPHIFWPWTSPLLGSGNLIDLTSEQLKYMYTMCKKISSTFDNVKVVRGNRFKCVKEILF